MGWHSALIYGFIIMMILFAYDHNTDYVILCGVMTITLSIWRFGEKIVKLKDENK